MTMPSTENLQRDHQDVIYVMERKIATENVKIVTRTPVPEKYRLRDDNEREVFNRNPL